MFVQRPSLYSFCIRAPCTQGPPPERPAGHVGNFMSPSKSREALRILTNLRDKQVKQLEAQGRPYELSSSLVFFLCCEQDRNGDVRVFWAEESTVEEKLRLRRKLFFTFAKAVESSTAVK